MSKTLKMMVLAIGILGLASCATDQKTVRRNLPPDTTTEQISVPEKSDNTETETPVPDSGDTTDEGTTNTQSEPKN